MSATPTTSAARVRPAHLPAAEIALVSVTVAVVYGFSRVFLGWGFFGPLLVVALFSHVAAIVLRRRGWSVPTSLLATLAGWVLIIGWMWFPSTTRLALPSPATWTALREELVSSWGSFQQLTAPAPIQTGFVIAASAAVLFAVFLADWAAFRLWSSMEALVPMTTLFIFCTLLAGDAQRLTSASVFVACSLAFLLAHRVARLETGPGWLTQEGERGGRALMRTGAALCAVAVVGGAVVGPRLPGADQSALVEWRGTESGPGSRVTISPLVDIRSRLVDQSDREVFTVESTQRAYWRLTALDTFDGSIWRSGGKYSQADGSLEATVPTPDDGNTVHQQFTIGSLDALWLPAAFQPTHIDPGNTSVRYQPESSTLIVDNKYSDSDGISYSLESVIPSFTPAELESASEDAVPPEIAETYAQDPPGLSPSARAIAEQAVVGAGGKPYDEAVALQNFFQSRFTYSTDVQPGHDDNAIDDFLRRRVGYCEQFAGTFAAMARSLGLPTRVAVGFTWGDQDPKDPNRYVVEGRHAHAWPEVYLAGAGWVAFEPTPQRGIPGAEAYTGVPEQQESGAGQQVTSTTTTTAPTSTTTSQASSSQDPGALDQLLAEQGSQAPSAGTGASQWVKRLGAIGLTLLGLLGLYAVAVPALRTRRRLHRRAAARDCDARVRLAWMESLEGLELVGASPRPEETHDEFARRAAIALPEQAEHIQGLAVDTDVATFAPGSLDETTARRAQTASTVITESALARCSRHQRLFRALDPRPLWSGSGTIEDSRRVRNR